jgi:hypothetical protein
MTISFECIGLGTNRWDIWRQREGLVDECDCGQFFALSWTYFSNVGSLIPSFFGSDFHTIVSNHPGSKMMLQMPSILHDSCIKKQLIVLLRRFPLLSIPWLEGLTIPGGGTHLVRTSEEWKW